MSKILYACSKRSCFNEDTQVKIRQICQALEPDNLRQPVQHEIHVENTVAYGIMNVHTFTHGRNSSLLVGYLLSEKENWDRPGEPFPDGSYAIFRHSAGSLEVVCDPAGTRTIWYYHDRDLFVASTSQRAIIMFIGSFEFDERVIPWMLSSGSLGPVFSWDRRVRRLIQDASVRLDKGSWTLSKKENPVHFQKKETGYETHKERLTQAITGTIDRIGPVDSGQWAFALSGGYDSRMLLALFSARLPDRKLSTITWGAAGAQDTPHGDAFVASKLSDFYGTRHRYLHTDAPSFQAAEVMDRFLRCSEGRIDHLMAYMDGMAMWRTLTEKEGIKGIVRGDEGFGWIPVSSEETARHCVGFRLCTDYRNMERLVGESAIPEQEVPSYLQRRGKESIHTWRDRLYHTYRIPSIISALSDIKLSYVEQMAPFLSRSILTVVRELPDELRTDKLLFKQIVKASGPDIPIATQGANQDLSLFFSSRNFIDLVESRLRDSSSHQLLGPKLPQNVLSRFKESRESQLQSFSAPFKKRLRTILPDFFMNQIRDTVLRPAMNANRLILRTFILIRMGEILKADAVRAKAETGR